MATKDDPSFVAADAENSRGIVLDGFPAEIPAFPYSEGMAARMPNMLS
ncbi:hypothetical protein [Azotobacter salinestris]